MDYRKSLAVVDAKTELSYRRFYREFSALCVGVRRLPVRLAQGDLGLAVRQSVDGQRGLLAVEGAEISLKIQENLPLVFFDAEAVGHMLQNLLDNAEKYSRLSLKRVIEVELRAKENFIYLSVRDYGDGLRDKVQSLIKPFFRGKEADHPAGLGLGLALVDALARAHGGTLQAENAEGGGARFTVSFPL